LQAICFSTYLTDIAVDWRPRDHDAHKFIDAIKDRDINGYAYVRVRGKWLRFDNANRQDVVGWFATMVGHYFEAENLRRNVALVPVPGSKCDLKFRGTLRTATLAEAIAETVNGATVRDVLRWKKAMPSANEEGGTRDPQELLANLTLRGSVDGTRVVLVDDVLTSGGHLQACAALLRQKGARVRRAVCAGRADDTQPADPFAIRVEDVDEYEP
jgi:hypothetical protein